MELSAVKNFVKRNISTLSAIQAEAALSERYYAGHNDIMDEKPRDGDDKTPLRNADNRVCSSFYPLLVDQKAAYAFTAAPLFDTGNAHRPKSRRRPGR